MSHSEEGEANYWPGYVDALTSMVQVLAFVMMMLAMAVFVLSQSVSKHAVEAIAKAANVEVKPNSDIKQLMQTVIDQIQRTQQPPKNEPEKQPAASSAPPTPSVEQKPPSPVASTEAPEKSNPDMLVGKRISPIRPRDQAAVKAPPDAPRILLNFETRSFRLEPDRLQSLAAFAETNRLVESKRAIVINAYAYSGDGALSEARRLAYYRAMMVRKQLIDRKVLPENIRVNVLDTADKDQDSIVESIIASDSAH
jgi:hypothetical protein